ncbi:MAG: nucleotidyltransferase family protein [Sphingobacteriales bacterium]|nr:MAG: nucleotidyltransferase family protein [Sphingobacteriales bacterium]
MKQFAVVILAAGSSSRMGSPKQLLAHKGSTFLEHTIQTARHVFGENIFLVLGANAGFILDKIHTSSVHIIINDHWEHGMGSSIAVGLDKAIEIMPDLSAVMFMTIDQPYINAEHLRDIVSRCVESGKPIVASGYKGTAGIPAMFDKKFFPGLLNLDGDKGAKEIIKLHPDSTTLVPLAFGEIDIDTPEQYAALKQRENK